jgi:hypothetical protein
LHEKSMQRGDVSQKELRFLLQTLLILDRWYETPMFPPQMRDVYRQTVVHLAIGRAKRQPALGLAGQLEVFRQIKSGSSRFGRDLFPGQFYFLASIFVARLRSLFSYSWRFIGTSGRSVLGSTRYEA